MSDEVFTHDVFLSHSSKDKSVVRPLAERLRKDGLKGPCNFGFVQPGPFRFRDPLNKERRFIPLRLDNAPIEYHRAVLQYI